MRQSILRVTLATAWLAAAVAMAADDLPNPPAQVIDEAVVPCTCCADPCCSEPSCATCCQCPRCREACCATVEPVTEEHTCWEVKCKPVCVPAIRLPWQRGGCCRNGLVDCLCRICCGSFSYAACGSWRAAHNCCDGCSPPLVLPDACDGCGGCCECCGCCQCCSCPQPRCGYVRYVNVLEEKTYGVTKCHCKWEVRRLPCCQEVDCCAEDCAERADSEIRFDSEAEPMPIYPEPDE